MARNTRAAASTANKANTSKKTTTGRKVKQEEDTKANIKQEQTSPAKPTKGTKRAAADTTSARRSKRVKSEDDKTGLLSPADTDSKSISPSSSSPEPSDDDSAEYTKSRSKSKSTPKSKSKSKAQDLASKSKIPDPQTLSDRKLKAYFAHANQSPYPDFPHPTPSEAKLAHKILSSLHGARVRPKEVIASKDHAGCGDSPSVLDALVRTILSQNTSDTNSTRAKKNMDAVYGGSDEWERIVAGGQPKLEAAIKSGGLAAAKSRNIMRILEQAKEKYGEYSLDHLHDASNEDAMREMLAFQGVGPKTASCVLLFCLQRESFAVDTHVHRITGLLGWRPKSADREQAHAHLDVRIPDEDKYGLHILLVHHGKVCDECKAGGKNVGKCELRKAFRQGKVKGEAGEEVKEEEEEKIKEEEMDDDDDEEDDEE